MAVQRKEIRYLRGTDRTLRLTVFDENGDRLDITGATIWFHVKATIDAGSTVLEKITPTQITILAQTGATLGQADITIDDTDLTAQAPGLLVYDVMIELGGVRQRVIKPANFILERGVVEGV